MWVIPYAWQQSFRSHRSPRISSSVGNQYGEVRRPDSIRWCSIGEADTLVRWPERLTWENSGALGRNGVGRPRATSKRFRRTRSSLAASLDFAGALLTL